MRLGVDLLQDAELAFESACACNRERCRFCVLRHQIREYLDIALRRDQIPTDVTPVTEVA